MPKINMKSLTPKFRAIVEAPILEDKPLNPGYCEDCGVELAKIDGVYWCKKCGTEDKTTSTFIQRIRGYRI